MVKLTRFRPPLIATFLVALLPLTASAARRTMGVEPGPERLAPVDPAWKAAGWRAVVPHAYVVTKLLAVRVAPEPTADIVFHLKGGVRVPVLEQQRDWWKIQWTDGRTGWARAVDLQPRATVLLLDAATGRLLRRVAVKGQWGFLPDGNRLWSLANTGLTRTDLLGTPRFWSHPTTQEIDGDLPDEGRFSHDRKQLFFPARTAKSWRLGQVDTHTGVVRKTACPQGSLVRVVGSVPRAVIKQVTAVSVVGHGFKARKIPGELLGVTPDGRLFLKRRTQIVTTSSSGKVLARAKLPRGFMSAFLTAGERTLAVCYDASGYTPNGVPSDLRVKLLDAGDLTAAGSLKLNTFETDVWAVMRGSGGWFVVTKSGENGSRLERYNSRGLSNGTWDVSDAYVFDPKRRLAFTDQRGIIAIPLTGGKPRQLGASWRREIPEGFLPKDPHYQKEVWPQVTDLALSSDGRTLIVTERLAGDPAG